MVYFPGEQSPKGQTNVQSKDPQDLCPRLRPASFLPCLRAARAEGARVPGRQAYSLGLGSEASLERRWGRSGCFF